jgi:hypothetical protein
MSSTQILGSSLKKRSLFDFFIEKKLKEEKIALYEGASRFLIDMDDIFFYLQAIRKDKTCLNSIITFFYPIKIKIAELIPFFEIFFSKKAVLDPLLNKTGNYEIAKNLRVPSSVLTLSMDFGAYVN